MFNFHERENQMMVHFQLSAVFCLQYVSCSLFYLYLGRRSNNTFGTNFAILERRTSFPMLSHYEMQCTALFLLLTHVELCLPANVLAPKVLINTQKCLVSVLFHCHL